MWVARGQNFAAFVLPLAIANVGYAQCAHKYEVQTLYGAVCPFIGHAGVSLSGINDAGNACGSIGYCGKGADMIIWNGEHLLSRVPMPLTFDVQALSINDQNVIAGIAEIPSGQNRGFIYRDGESLLLNTLAGHNWAEAYSIANDGAVVGYSNGGSALVAVKWQGLNPIILDLPIGPKSIAYDISGDTGYICGWMGIHPDPNFGSRAFRWHDGNVVDLGLPPGSESTEARGVNNLGQVCGATYYLPPEAYIRGFFWSNGRMEEIDALPGYPNSFAYDLNDAGQVIGRSYNNDLVGPTFIWQNGVMAPLDDLIPRESGLSIWLVWTINNAGQIAGVALDRDLNQIGVILTPIQPPPGDCDCNGRIDMDDLLGVINQWGPTIPTTTADFNNDGSVSVQDLIEVLNRWSA